MTSRSKWASRWYAVLRSSERLSMRGEVRITGTRWYKRWSRGAGSTELRGRARGRTERTGPGPVVRRTGIIRGWRKTSGIWWRSGTGGRGTARRGGGGVLRRRRTGRGTLIRRCAGRATGTAGKRTWTLETRIARWTARVVVRTRAGTTALTDGIGRKGRCLRTGRRALPGGWRTRILQRGGGCQWCIQAATAIVCPIGLHCPVVSPSSFHLTDHPMRGYNQYVTRTNSMHELVSILSRERQSRG